MIISKTPFRISFAGGGSDLREFYKHKPGAVTSATIDKYMYVTVNKSFYDNIRVSYSQTGTIVNDVQELKHGIIRECMKKANVTSGVEITTTADVPAKTGLGTSSSLTVGVLNALYALRGVNASPEKLAKDACEIETKLVPIGKQDQYAAAYGGLNHITFNPDETATVEPVKCHKTVKEELNGNLLMFYLGARTGKRNILKEQKKKTKKNIDVLDEMVKLSVEVKYALERGRLREFGEIMNQGWGLKKKLASGISNRRIDGIYGTAMKAGAVGGKVLGEGGAGFILFYCEKGNQGKLREKLKPLARELEFNLEDDYKKGSQIVYAEESRWMVRRT